MEVRIVASTVPPPERGMISHMDPWVIWLIAAGVVAAAELLSGDFFLLMLAGGALAGSVTAAIGGPVWLQIVVFGVVSLLLVGTARPIAKRALMKGMVDYPDGVQALIGTEAVVSQAIDAHGGRIKLGHNEWSALSLSPHETYQIGAQVRIVEIRGAHAVVTNEL